MAIKEVFPINREDTCPHAADDRMDILPARDDIDMMKIQRCFIRDESDLMVLVESYDGYWN